jgi:GT2 family glycosyltransferase
MIDVVIPTILKSDINVFKYTIEEMQKATEVKSIIIIDNTPSCEFSKQIGVGSKIQLIENKKNVYVNPAWNQGVALSTEDNVVILNDDILCDYRVFNLMSSMMNSNKDIGLLTVLTRNDMRIEEYKNCANNFNYDNVIFGNKFGSREGDKTGWLMCIDKSLWKPLPETLKIWFGDDLIYRRIRQMQRKVLSMENVFVSHNESSSIKKCASVVNPVINADIIEYNKIVKRY